MGGEGESFRVERPGEGQEGEARRREVERSRVREEAHVDGRVWRKAEK